jgi:ABC-type multidrug transport system ATPase subunit
VLYNKAEYYSQMDVYRSSIGYVPQDDIVPSELTVRNALYYAARLRLPQDTTQAELHNRLDEVIDDLDLEQRRDTPIHLLSGGQRKRVSIGAELISKPSLFFLDEPTSGLDPGLEGRMMQLLRKLADQGRTVILITHATQNVELCDQVLFLARGGYMAFFGSPQSALEYFGVKRFSEIYIKLEQELSPEEWARRFISSPYYTKNVGARFNAIAREAAQYGVMTEHPAMAGQVVTGPAAPPVVFRRPKATLSSWGQFALLTRRYFEILTRDTKNLLILLLQAPIIALMLILVFKRNDFNRPGGDYGLAKTLVFLMVIVAVWFGTSNAAREIVKEASIYRRERRIGLKLAPYILSKLAVQSLLVLVQVALLVGIVWIGLGLGSPGFEDILYLYFTLVLTALGGVSMGLLISAITSNSDRATSFVPVALIPQIIFSGAVVSFERMGQVGEWFSNLMISKWGYQASARILNLDTIPSTPLRFNGPAPDQADRIEALFPGSVFLDRRTLEWYFVPKRSPEFTTDVYLQWGILGLAIAIGLGLIIFFQLRKDHKFSR